VALGTGAAWRPLPRERVGAARLEAALERLDDASPGVKARLLAACEACARADGRVLAAEAEVLRAVAASLGAPTPLVDPVGASLRTAGAA
jgi:tellurite resistance protein